MLSVHINVSFNSSTFKCSYLRDVSERLLPSWAEKLGPVIVLVKSQERWFVFRAKEYMRVHRSCIHFLVAAESFFWPWLAASVRRHHDALRPTSH